MIIGVPKEVKTRENRVAVVPGGVKLLKSAGHKILIEKNAGIGAGVNDIDFENAGATILSSAEEVWQQADMIIKVKEPIPSEYPLIRQNQILFTFLHLAADKKLAQVLLQKEVTGIAYETIELEDGSLPLLKPMSEVAGKMSIQAGIQCLQKSKGGKGVLLGGVPGVRRRQVAIIGGGIVGLNAAKIAVGLGAEVSIFDVNLNRLAYLDDIFGNRITTVMSNPENISYQLMRSDLVIGAVLVTGAKAPTLISEDMIKNMEPGSAVVDVAIDQGGCIETIKPTSLEEPTFTKHNIVHYGVTNIPGDVPLTSTYALSNVTLKYALHIANKGIQRAAKESKELRYGINTYKGKLSHKAVASALLPLEYSPINLNF